MQIYQSITCAVIYLLSLGVIIYALHIIHKTHQNVTNTLARLLVQQPSSNLHEERKENPLDNSDLDKQNKKASKSAKEAKKPKNTDAEPVETSPKKTTFVQGKEKFEENIKNANYSGIIHKFTRDGKKKERPVMVYIWKEKPVYFEYDERGKVIRLDKEAKRVLETVLNTGENTLHFKKYEIKNLKN